MKVLILAAGYGTRLYPLTLNIPKALLNIGNRFLIDFLIDKVKIFEEEIVIISNNKFYPSFVEWKEKRKYKNLKILNDNTNTPAERLGTLGDIKFVIDKLEINDDILVLGSDNIFDWSLKKFVEFSKLNNKYCMGVYDIGDLQKAAKFGVVKTGREKEIVSMMEKPKKPETTDIATCIYFFPKEGLHRVDEYALMHKDKDTSGKFIEWLYKEERVLAYQFKGVWMDIGHKEILEEANLKFGGAK